MLVVCVVVSVMETVYDSVSVDFACDTEAVCDTEVLHCSDMRLRDTVLVAVCRTENEF